MEILEQFGIKPVLLAAQVVNFLILLYILKRFLYGPILKILNERKGKIADSLKNAEEIERKLQEIGEKETETIMKAAKEGEKIIQQSGQAATQMIDDAKLEYDKIIKKAVEDAKEVMKSERVQLEQEIKENLSDVVVLALEKVMGKVLGKEQKQLIEKTVKEIK